MDRPRPEVNRILVIDDDPLNQEYIQACLEHAGYQVELARDGHQALATLTAKPPDLVLLDVLMPGLNGFETCRRIRALPAGVDLPILFLSCLNDMASHEQALEAGGDDFLSRPIQLGELIMRVRSLLRIRRLQEELKRRYAEIQGQNEMLRRSQDQRRQLMSVIIHELRGPLTGMVTNVEFMSREPGLPLELKESLDDFKSSVRSMERMVMNLVALHRHEEQRLLPSRSVIEVRPAVERAVEDLSLQARDRSIAVRLECAAEVGVGEADPGMFQGLLENLLANAIRQATPGSTIRIDARCVDQALELGVAHAGGRVPEREREALFDGEIPLEAAVGAGPPARKVGLAFCRVVAEAHGGRIWIEDYAPDGNDFRVRLPLSASS